MFSHRFLSGFQTRGSDTSLTLNTFPKDQLRRQYEYYLPVAVNSWDANSSQPNFDAWRTSVRTRARNGEPGNSYIKQVVKRLGGGWTASSSGCERVFGTQKRSFEPHREDCGRDAVESELVLEGLNQVQQALSVLITSKCSCFSRECSLPGCFVCSHVASTVDGRQRVRDFPLPGSKDSGPHPDDFHILRESK